MDSEKSIAAIVLSNEEQLLRSAVRTSPKELSALIGDEFIEIGSSGRIYTKQDVIETLQKESPFEGSISDFKTYTLVPKIILVTYRMEESQKNGVQSRISIRSSIWKLTDGKWKIIFHQGTVSHQ